LGMRMKATCASAVIVSSSTSVKSRLWNSSIKCRHSEYACRSKVSMGMKIQKGKRVGERVGQAMRCGACDERRERDEVSTTAACRWLRFWRRVVRRCRRRRGPSAPRRCGWRGSLRRVRSDANSRSTCATSDARPSAPRHCAADMPELYPVTGIDRHFSSGHSATNRRGDRTEA
jgi:hypothetical protein